jgi:hypothetical protein
MVLGSPILETVQWIIVRMGPLLSTEEISNFTDVGERRVRQILKHFRNTGDVDTPKRAKNKVNRSLREEHVEVCSM